MGAQVPSGHRSAPTEPAGETVSSRSDDGRGLSGSFIEAARSAVLRSKMGVLQTPKRFLAEQVERKRNLARGTGKSLCASRAGARARAGQ